MGNPNMIPFKLSRIVEFMPSHLHILSVSYLGNVFGFEKVIDIEEHFDGNPKLKEVVDNPLDPVGGLHLVGGERPLLLPQRGGAALEDHLLNNPEMGKFDFHNVDVLLTHVVTHFEPDFPLTLVRSQSDIYQLSIRQIYNQMLSKYCDQGDISKCEIKIGRW